ncbi:MAG: hypothetical protein C0608_05980 [Deltaproteobacteria bacterium]|nr:MAG: hypothetical protein C0608_05980 [Deltaproteobacteria bacterium]
MAKVAVHNLAGYMDAGSVIHGLDPRAKIVIALLAIGGTGATGSWLSLAAVFVIISIAAHLSGLGALGLIGRMRPLNFLILFTAMMHFFSTPGRMLPGFPIWGVGWTLEGSAAGLGAAAQLAAAVAFSIMLAATTKPLEVALSIEWVLSPLKLIGVPVGDLTKVLNVALRAIPILSLERERVMRLIPSRVKERGWARSRLFVAALLLRRVLSLSLSVEAARELDGYEARRRDLLSSLPGFGINEVKGLALGLAPLIIAVFAG